jgi:hypothetical protein
MLHDGGGVLVVNGLHDILFTFLVISRDWEGVIQHFAI